MSAIGGPNIVEDGLVLALDAANVKSFRGEPTTNTVVFPGAGAARYNNPGFSGSIINTGETFMGSPIWEVTFIPQDSARIPRLGSTEGFGFFHSMGTRLFPNTQYMASVYVKSEYPLQSSTSQGFNNTYSNISGWGFGGTSTTRLQEGEWTRLYSKFFRNTVISGVSYMDRSVNNTLNTIVNTTQTTQVLVTVTIQSNGTFSTSTDFGTSTAGGTIIDYNNHVGLRSANPNITNAGGISGLSTGTSAIINHGLNTSTWTKMSDNNPVFKTSYPFQYYVLMNIPSTGGNNATVSFRLSMSGFYSSLSDNKFWKVTFNTSNLQVNDVIRTYWTAPMIEEHSRDLPSRFTVGTRGTTVATGGGWVDRSGNNNHGELVNGPTFDSNNFGSLQFDGVDDFISIPNITMGNGNLPWTISAWIKTTTTANSLGQGSIISNSSGGPVYSMLGVNNGRIVYWTYQNNAWSQKLGNSIINDGNWHNLTWVNYQNSTMDMYVNGVLDANVANSTSGNNNPLDIVGGSWAGRYSGLISNLSIYKTKSLTPQEVFQNYNATKGRYGL